MYSHQEFEELTRDEDNQRCFDCNRKPAHWASVNTSIYLCLNCAGDHRGFGVNISYVRSITMDSWSDNQLKIMRIGGNKRLSSLLDEYSLNKENKEILFKSKLLEYHRKELKSEINKNDDLNEKPEKEDALLPLYEEARTPKSSNSFDLNTTSGFKRYNSVSNESVDEKMYSRFSLYDKNKKTLSKYNTNTNIQQIDTSFYNPESGAKSHNIVHSLAIKANSGVNYIFKKIFGDNSRKTEETAENSYSSNM